MSRALRTLSTLALLGGAAALASCDGEVPLTAPEGAELTITANPTAIPVDGGASTVTVVGFKGPEDGGGPLSDGTQIFFTTNVGLIEERVEMRNGVARATLLSAGRAGLATVTAQSGAGIVATLENPVLIGNAEGINILLTANPPTVEAPDFSTQLVATVFDNDNNRMPSVPIIFTTTAGALASQSTSLRTNALGQATDRLTLLDESSATVTAFSGGVSSNQVSVSRATEVGPVVASISPTSGLPGQTLNVTISGQNFQPGAVVSFGEGIAVNFVTFISPNQLIANISIDPNARVTTAGRTVTVTNPDGGTGSLANAFLVTTPGAAPPPFISDVSPTDISQRGSPVTLTINGTGFQTNALVSLNPGGITINGSPNVISSTQIQVSITVPSNTAVVPTGTQFDVTVRNPDGGEDTLVDAFTVTS